MDVVNVREDRWITWLEVRDDDRARGVRAHVECDAGKEVNYFVEEPECLPLEDVVGCVGVENPFADTVLHLESYIRRVMNFYS